MLLNKLDPRLRRLQTTQDDIDLMEMAAGRGEITTSESGYEPSTLSKRVLIELTTEASAEALKGLDPVRVTETIYTANVPLTRLAALNDLPSVQAVEAGRRWYPMLDSSVPETGAHHVHAGLGGTAGREGSGVVVGIIDYGMDFTLDDFRDEQGKTRIAYLWDQWLDPIAGENAPNGFNYGTEYDRAQIDAALSAADPFAVVRHKPEAASHGTHVAGTAVGNGRSFDAAYPAGHHVGTAPKATIIFVQPNSSDQSSTFTDSSNVADAVAYVMEKADTLGMPCVINMSLGQSGGSHDGESIVERAIDRMLEKSGRAFVSAAGNEHIWRGHAAGTITTGNSRDLRWKIGGGMPIPGGGMTGTGQDFTESEMEIWYSSHDRFRVTLTAPDGTRFGPVEPEGFISQSGVYIDSERYAALNGQARIYIELSPPSQFQPITSGEWIVTLDALEGENGAFDAWIERTRRDSGNNYADQSFFMGNDFEPTHTLGTPASRNRGSSFSSSVVLPVPLNAARPSTGTGDCNIYQRPIEPNTVLRISVVRATGSWRISRSCSASLRNSPSRACPVT